MAGSDVEIAVKMAAGLVAIVNPIGVIPRFMTLTASRPPAEARAIALKTTLASFVTLVLASLAGERMLGMFGISLPAFRVAGGILILLIAISMFSAQPPLQKYRPEETAEALDKSDIAIVPMAIPFLSGPGAISTVILYEHHCRTWTLKIALWGTIALTSLLVYGSLRLAESIKARISQTGLNIFTRLMGLILAAVAIEFITKGLGEIFPAWSLSPPPPEPGPI